MKIYNKIIAFSLIFLIAYGAFAECPSISDLNNSNPIVVNSTSFDSTSSVTITSNNDGSLGISISITNAADNTLGKTVIGPNQYTQLYTSIITYYDYIHGGQIGPAYNQPSYKQIGEIAAWNLSDGTKYIIVRSAELDSSLSTTVLTKTSGSSSFASQCYPSSLSSFDYEDFISQIIAKMSDPVFVDLSDYSPSECDVIYGPRPFCTGAFINSAAIYYSFATADGGPESQSSSPKNLIVRANQLVSLALRSAGPVNRKNLLKRASSLSNEYLATKPRARVSNINKLKKAIKLSLKSTRKTAPDSEVSSSLRALKAAIKSFL